MKKLSGKNIIITGASSGIGRACAILCSKEGANLQLIGRNEKALRETLALLKKGDHAFYTQDITDFEAISGLVNKIVSEHGKISGFIHSAGMQILSPIQTLKPVHFQKSFDLNVISAFEISKHLGKNSNHVKDDLSIVFISSVTSEVASAGMISYAASKAALVGGARALALEYANKNIRVNLVSPGIISDTKMTIGLSDAVGVEQLSKIESGYPLGFGKSRDVANLCVYLLSDASRWMTGQNIVIDGGYSVR
ncbi:MAG: SDR family oxidoreductase [Candidatus Cloacimonetes bacterium]|nr:SDR family oxidoreductase [Candidatus Cloacimonadota bacterium]